MMGSDGSCSYRPLTVTQINLQHSKAATALLSRRLTQLHTLPHITTVQEPWVFRGRLCGFGTLKGATILYDRSSSRPRTGLIVSSHLTVTCLEQFCCQDLVAAEVCFKGRSGWLRFVIASAYFPYDALEAPPPGKAAGLVRFCERRNLGLILCCDANAQHTIWGSSKCNGRGSQLFEFIASSCLNIHNKGRQPTFVTARRQEVIDLTLSNSILGWSVKNWRVLAEDTCSDHRYIEFQCGEKAEIPLPSRNPRKTDWQKFREALRGFNVTPPRLRKEQDIEVAVEKLNTALTECFESACPIRPLPNRTPVPWWNRELQVLRRESRKLLNRALKTNLVEDWERYRQVQKNYKKLIRESKRASFREFCSGIESLSDTAKLVRILKKDPTAKLGSLRKSDGSFTERQSETLSLLMESHFPGNQINIGRQQPLLREDVVRAATPSRHDWYVARSVANEAAIRFAIKSFDGYKSPGLDGIYPVMLKEGIESVTASLKKIFTACLALAYIPRSWRMVRVAFIPKAGRDDYSSPKSFRPISMTSFMLKSLERLVELRMRQRSLNVHPLSPFQHAYRSGKSCESALQNLVARVELAIDRRDYAMGIFLDIEGAFDNATFDSMCSSASRHGVDRVLVNWIRSMLAHRIVMVRAEEDLLVSSGVNRGCPQGGVLSPLLWCMVIDPLLTTLNDAGVYAQAYADDVACLLTGPSLMNLCRKVQKTLDMIDTWCCANGLSVNPTKTGIVLFTRRRKLDGLILPKLKGVTIQLSKEIKYLGVILDSKLIWKSHVETKASKALTAFWQCKGVFGKTWGLSPGKILWIYTAMIRPIITYASVVWMSRLSLVGVRRTLSRLQRTVAVCCTGAFPTTSGPALDALIGVPPLDAFIQGEALKAICRLKHNGNWYGSCTALDNREGMDFNPTIFSMPLDSMPSRVVLEKRYSVMLPEAQLWSNSENEPGKHCFRIFTDGSRTEHGSGSGVYVESSGTKLHFALGMYASVFQAEVYAVQEAMNFVVENRWRGRSICVCSDSKAALMALDRHQTTSGVVESCKSRLNYVGRHNILILTWVPGHVGIAGNETSDSLARMGSEANFFGPEPVLPLPSAAITATVSKRVTLTHKRAWQAERGCRWTKLMLPVMSDQLSRILLSISRRDCRQLVGLMTGHFLWAKHMEKVGISDSALCPACGEEEETAEHFMCVCPAFARIRLEVFGTDVLRSDQLGSLAPQDLLRFLRRSGRFKEN